MTGSAVPVRGLGRRLPARASAVWPFHHPAIGRGWSPG